MRLGWDVWIFLGLSSIMPCFTISWESQFGKHSSSKWGADAKEALGLLKKQHSRLTAQYKGLSYGTVSLMSPQPFTPEAACLADLLHGRNVPTAGDAVSLPVAIFEADADDLGLTDEHERAA